MCLSVRKSAHTYKSTIKAQRPCGAYKAKKWVFSTPTLVTPEGDGGAVENRVESLVRFVNLGLGKKLVNLVYFFWRLTAMVIRFCRLGFG